MKLPLGSVIDNVRLPTLLVVGCGRIGEALVKTYIEESGLGGVKVYVTDSDKERARKLSEFRLSSITPVKWKYASDTPEDVDVIVIAVDHDSEKKIMDRVLESGKKFVSLTDSALVYEEYLEKTLEREDSRPAVLGTGLVPGISDVLLWHATKRCDRVLDIVVERLGFVSSASLASIKHAMKEQPLSVRDGIVTDSKRSAGASISWFPSPWGATECSSVAVGVESLHLRYPDVHNISVRFAEPKLPTFNERVKNIFFHVPLTTTRACIRVEVTGLVEGEVQTIVESIAGDAMTIITATTLLSAIGLHNSELSSGFYGVEDVVDSEKLLVLLHNVGCDVMRFEPSMS
jgi:NADH/NAD ratio-sensing transcriptional regulator Rex